MSFHDSPAYKEAIYSAEEVEGYLRRHVSALTGLKGLWVQFHSGDHITVHAPKRSCGGEILSIQGLNQQEVDAYAIRDINVAEDLRGIGLGSVGVKALCGMAYGDGANVLMPQGVLETGCPFWDAMGGTPLQEPLFVAGFLERQLSWRTLPPNQCRKIEAIAEIAEDNARLGLALFLRMKASDADDGLKAIQADILQRACYSSSLLLFPSAPRRREDLRAMLGEIPPFRPLEPDNPYLGIVKSLEGREEMALKLHL